MSIPKSILWLGATLLLALMLVACGSDNETEATAQASNGQASAQTKIQPVAQDAASQLGSIYADHINGKTYQLSEWIGQQPVVINFWGTWCPPCRREIPDMIKIYEEYQNRGVEILSLAMPGRDTPESVARFASEMQMDWVMMMANEQTMRAFRFQGSVPTTVFLDKDGNEKARFVGGRNYEQFKDAFEKITAGS